MLPTVYESKLREMEFKGEDICKELKSDSSAE